MESGGCHCFGGKHNKHVVFVMNQKCIYLSSNSEKSLTCVPRLYVSEGAEQIWGELEHLVAQIFEKMQKICKQMS